MILHGNLMGEHSPGKWSQQPSDIESDLEDFREEAFQRQSEAHAPASVHVRIATEASVHVPVLRPVDDFPAAIGSADLL
jgi:hypothetical protein